MRQATRAYNLALLSRIVEGRLTDKEVNDLRKSREPVQLTLNVCNEFIGAVQDPTYHIEIYSDGTARSYNRFADGRVEDR